MGQQCTMNTNYPCEDNTFLVAKKVKSIMEFLSKPDSVGYSRISTNLTEYDTAGIIKSVKFYPYEDGYCTECIYSYNNTDCTYEIDYKHNCGIIEPIGVIGSIRGYKLLEKHLFYDYNTGLKVEENVIYDLNVVVFKYRYNPEGLVISISKYLNQQEQYLQEFKYEYYK